MLLMHSAHPIPIFVWFLQQADDTHNFTAIWVFTPNKGGRVTFQVFQEFDVVPEGPVNDMSELSLSIPEGGYGKPVFSQDLEPNFDGHQDDDDDDDEDDEEPNMDGDMDEDEDVSTPEPSVPLASAASGSSSACISTLYVALVSFGLCGPCIDTHLFGGL